MKYLLLTLFFFCSLSYADYYAKVTYVFDGDTVTITKQNQTKWRVRLSNIDAPEISNKHKIKASQPYAQQSKKQLMNLTLNKTVRVKESGTDDHGRLLAELFIGDVNINKAMVAQGYAWVYRYKLKDTSYISLENNAKTKKIGLWNDRNPIEPYQWRKN